MAAKRGRKKKTNFYFGPTEEAAVIEFLASDDVIERNNIYNKFLRKPLNKMVESLIRKYNLHRDGVSFEDLHSDTLSFLMLKADRFDNTSEKNKGKKAYSYYGTICKNYMIGLLKKDAKELNRYYKYDDFSTTIESDDKHSYVIDDVELKISRLVNRMIDEIKEEIKVDENVKQNKKINENEIKVGMALIAILEDWGTILDHMKGGKKFSKLQVLESIRNYTNLTTKDIRVSLKRFIAIYSFVKLDELDELD